MQEDTLRSLPPGRRRRLQDMVACCVEAASSLRSSVIWTGVRFEADYANLSPSHRIYGALKRINEKNPITWFLAGSGQLPPTADRTSDIVCWRSESLPLDLRDKVQELQCKTVTIVGLKISHMVLSVCQVLCDLGIRVQVVRQAVEDDSVERGDAILEHMVPIFADLIDINVYLGSDYKVSGRPIFPEKKESHIRYLTDCGRGGHFGIYASHLLQYSRQWAMWPTQDWYSDFRQYKCPLGQKIVDFCDEPQFSQISVFLKGREHLDEKDKLMLLDCDDVYMPRSYLLRNGQWVGDPVFSEEDLQSQSLWFVKEANKNGGRAIIVTSTLAQALLDADPRTSYIVQEHIPDPLLSDGCKCHVKVYNLLVVTETWDLFTYRDGFLSKSANPWSLEDQSTETQVTTLRTHRLEHNGTFPWPEAGTWNDVYHSCQEAVKNVVGHAIRTKKLQPRPGQKQFEIFSADFMLDRNKQVWLIEFNFTPVMYDPTYFNDDNLGTTGLRVYHDAYKREGKNTVVNDHEMVRDVTRMIFAPSSYDATESKWDHVNDFSEH